MLFFGTKNNIPIDPLIKFMGQQLQTTVFNLDLVAQLYLSHVNILFIIYIAN